MLEKIQKMDQRIIYLVLLIALSFPMFRPLGLPVSIGQTSQDLYDFIDQLDPGSVVVLSIDYSPGAAAQIHPQTIAITKHLLSKKIKIVYMGLVQYASQFTTDAIAKAGDYNPVYGQDYVDLGFKPGEEATVSAMSKDIHATFVTDSDGTAIAELPMMADIKTASDIDLVIAFDSGGTRHWYVGQMQALYGTPVGCALNSVNVTNTMPYYDAGQVIGLLNGLRGAAEYEALIGDPGEATINLDSISSGHLVIILFILFGNIAYFGLRNSNKRKEA